MKCSGKGSQPEVRVRPGPDPPLTTEITLGKAALHLHGDHVATPPSLSGYCESGLKRCCVLRFLEVFKQCTKCNWPFNQELLSSFPWKNSLRSSFFLSPQWPVLGGISPSSSSSLYFFLSLFILVNLFNKKHFSWTLYHFSKSNGNVTCPSLFVTKFRDKEEDRLCFLKINGQHITVKPID